jgi:hypothetical protein
MAQFSDPDAAAVMGSFDHPEAANDSDAAAVLASYDAPKSGYRPKSGSDPVLSGKQPELGPMLLEGGREFAQGIVHGAGTLADVATGTSPGAGSHAERWASAIRTDPTLGGQISGQPAISPDAVSRTYDKSFGTGPLASTLKERIPQAVEAISTAIPVTKGVGGVAIPMAKGVGRALLPPVVDVQAAMDTAVANSPQSMGAAAAAQRVSSLSPPMQQGFREAVQKTGGAVNPEAAVNHAEADAHGVQLMDGQASRDPVQFSNEQNSTNKAISKRINDQETQMTDAIDNIRREAAPGAVQNNHIENGQIAVDSLKAHDEPVQADIRAKYKALVDANGGTVPIDPGSFLGNVDGALKKNYLTKSVPPAASELLDSLRSGEPLDFEGFEAARTRLAEAQREGGSGGQAARIIRGELEQLPLSPAAAGLKGLADSARSAAKARFDALEADPAYQAAVDDVSSGVKRGQPSPLADRFLDKYALGTAPKANVDTMMAKLDTEAQQAVASHTLNAIRKGAITPNGAVSPNGYNSAMQKYGPKLGSLVSSDTAESLDSLGRVITNAKVPPPGHSVNYSKSGVIVNAAQGLGEAAINAKTFGMGAPIIKNLSEGSWAKRTLKPGAGLTRLSDVAKP